MPGAISPEKKGAFVPTSRRPRMPQSLGSAGKRLWTTTLDEFEFEFEFEFELEAEPQKVEILTHACRVTDKIAELKRSQRSEPQTVLGSARHLTIHPLIAEVRFQRGLLAQLLGLPDTDKQIEAKREAVSAVRRDASKDGSPSRRSAWHTLERFRCRSSCPLRGTGARCGVGSAGSEGSRAVRDGQACPCGRSARDRMIGFTPVPSLLRSVDTPPRFPDGRRGQ